MYDLLWFDKLAGFNIPVAEDNKLFNNLATFDFESTCVPTEELKETQTKPGLESMFQFQSLYHQIFLINPSFCTAGIHRM